MNLYNEATRKSRRNESVRLKILKENPNLFPFAFCAPKGKNYLKKTEANALGIKAEDIARREVGYSDSTTFGHIISTLENDFKRLNRNNIQWFRDDMRSENCCRLILRANGFYGRLWYYIDNNSQHTFLVDEMGSDKGFRKFFSQQSSIVDIESWIKEKVFTLDW